MSRWLVGLLLLLLLSEMVVAEQAVCPIGEKMANLWCSTIFGRGGTVTAVDYGGANFYCICNGVGMIEINMPSATSCTWSGSFDDLPNNGNYCYSFTNSCPTSCKDMSEVCDTAGWTCRSDHTGEVSYTCNTCLGSVLTIESDNKSDCSKSYSKRPDTCTPDVTCGGHGCCRPDGSCQCHRSPIWGYWAEPSCRECIEGYAHSSSGPCTKTVSHFVAVLKSIYVTWTMVLPNVVVLLIFVAFGILRPLAQSDRTFDLTSLRRAQLSVTQTSRRERHSYFRSKYIPRRPAKSRSFVNGEDARGRGPSAY